MVLSMRRSVWMSLLAGMLALPLALAVAEDGPKPTDEAKPKQKEPREAKAREIKVAGVYAKLDLSDEQKQKIKAIQDDIREQMKKLREEEQARIDEVLTAEQKRQLEEHKPEPKQPKAAKEAEGKARN